MVCLPDPTRSPDPDRPEGGESPLASAAGDGAGQTASGSGGCVLLIEDHAGTRTALERVLRKAGYDPVSFGSASGAIEWLGRYGQGPSNDQNAGQPHRETRDIPAAILVDIHLPDGDGLALARRLRSELGDQVPIVVVSGDTSIETLSRLRDAGADRFVGKPVTPAALEAAILDASARAESASGREPPAPD